MNFLTFIFDFFEGLQSTSHPEGSIFIYNTLLVRRKRLFRSKESKSSPGRLKEKAPDVVQLAHAARVPP